MTAKGPDFVSQHFQRSPLAVLIVDGIPDLAVAAIADLRQQPVPPNSIVCRPRHS